MGAVLVAAGLLAATVACGTAPGRNGEVAAGDRGQLPSTALTPTTESPYIDPPPTPLYPNPSPTVPSTEPSPECTAASSPLEVDPETGIPITTTTIAPPGCFATTSLPPGRVRCIIFYGTLLPGEEKDVPVYRDDTHEQLATIHLPEGTWTPAEAEEMCA